MELDESLSDRRVAETARAAARLGIARTEYLGYRDSGMMGTPQNEAQECFWQADIEEAANRLAEILDEEHADVLTVYDENGGYGHPDHIQVHRVGVRAAEIAKTPRVYEATMNRDAIRRFAVTHQAEARDQGIETPFENPEEITMGTPEADITTTVDVHEFIDIKRAALAEHASQVDGNSFFLAIPVEIFRDLFSQEWFIRRGSSPLGQGGQPTRETSLFGP
jgi:LmbE family N-acetylglucosaminyl deacetylase